MDEKTKGAISAGIMDVMEKLIKLKKGEMSKEDAIKELTQTVINAASNHSRNSVNQSGDSTLKENIDQKSRDTIEDLIKKEKSDGPVSKSFNFLVTIANYAAGAIGGDKLVTFLNRDIKSFFKTKEESPFVEAGSNIGSMIGKLTPLPMGEYIGQQVGEFIASVGEYIDNTFGIQYTYKKLLMETEFSQENIKLLENYGIKQAKIAQLREMIFAKCDALDKEFEDKVKLNEEARTEMKDAIDKI